MSSTLPDYYKLLGLDDKRCTTEAIRAAYKRESLRTHPDRTPNASPEEKRAATAKFQAVADAYYVLSDPARRREYDALLAARAYTERSADADASNNFFANFANMFAGAAAGGNAPQTENKPEDLFGERPDPDATFGNVFDELLRPEVERIVPWWTILGAASGATLGFIIANIPGALMGGFAGNRLGAIRDAKGKSVMAVFNTLAADQKAEILKSLAFKVLGSM
ncbi:DnaJ-domain-containing protein [Serendipita vermifera]|nr:DnaJ-domain-containing protein [Serendipita vermifera]